MLTVVTKQVPQVSAYCCPHDSALSFWFSSEAYFLVIYKDPYRIQGMLSSGFSAVLRNKFF